MNIIVAPYCRVSTQEQAIHGYSIDEQISRMTKYCEAMGWTVFKVYTDAGFSGSNMNRPALQNLINDAKAGKINRVLVYKLDRLSRSQKDTLTLIEDVFLANSVDFVSMSENFDTGTPLGRAMIGILAVFAQLEREQIKERMNMGRAARAKQGRFHGSSRVPIGYDYVDGELVTNAFEKEQIKRIFAEYAAGKSPIAIAKDLNDAGLIHRYGKWTDATIRSILGKRTYTGYTQYRGEWFRGTHEAFIDPDQFDRVQRLKDQNRIAHEQYNRRLGKVSSYLGGYIYCARCGAKYCKTTYRSRNKRYVYYACYSRTQKHASMVKDPNCSNVLWKMDDLDQLVFGEIRKLALDPDYIRSVAQLEDNSGKEIVREKLEKINAQLLRLMDLYTVGSMPLDVLQKRVADLNAQKESLETELARIEEAGSRKLSSSDAVSAIRSFGDILDRGQFDEIRLVIGTLIDRIMIDGENIEIHWNFS